MRDLTDDAQSAAASTTTPAQPDDVVVRWVARRVRQRKDNRPGGADYVHVAGQLSIYDVPGVGEADRPGSART